MKFVALPTAEVEALRAGEPDAYGRAAERSTSDGAGNPCRHCLRMIPEGAPMLILAHRPFPRLDPYAETGPIFLCADPCERAPEDEAPAYLRFDALVKAYLPNDRIHYCTGRIVPPEAVAETAARLLEDPANAYVHVRSGRNNCYQFRVERG
ncbi:MAG: DUF1203 domain-containing protein [Pseudomonadota bacterium]